MTFNICRSLWFFLLFSALACHSTGYSDKIDPQSNSNEEGAKPRPLGARARQFCEAETCRGVLAEPTESVSEIELEGVDKHEPERTGPEKENDVDNNMMTLDGWDTNGYVTFCPCMGEAFQKLQFWFEGRVHGF